MTTRDRASAEPAATKRQAFIDWPRARGGFDALPQGKIVYCAECMLSELEDKPPPQDGDTRVYLSLDANDIVVVHRALTDLLKGSR